MRHLYLKRGISIILSLSLIFTLFDSKLVLTYADTPESIDISTLIMDSISIPDQLYNNRERASESENTLSSGSGSSASKSSTGSSNSKRRKRRESSETEADKKPVKEKVEKKEKIKEETKEIDHHKLLTLPKEELKEELKEIVNEKLEKKSKEETESLVKKYIEYKEKESKEDRIVVKQNVNLHTKSGREIKDVKEDDYYSGAVKFVVENEIIQGISEDEFLPKGVTTNAMADTILYRISGMEGDINDELLSLSGDKEWFSAAVEWAKISGIIFGDEYYDPSGEMRRDEFVLHLYRYSKKLGYAKGEYDDAVLNPFKDKESLVSFKKKSMKWAVANGIIVGTTELNLEPEMNITRGQLAIVIEKYLAYLNNHELSNADDNNSSEIIAEEAITKGNSKDKHRVVGVIHSVEIKHEYEDHLTSTQTQSKYPMRLDAGDEEGVFANYDKNEKLISIYGTGTITEEKWINLAHTIEEAKTSFTSMDLTNDGENNPMPYGWQIPSDINMVFQSGSKIQFEEPGFKGRNSGWFQDFKGSIELNDTLDTSNMTDMSFMFQGASAFHEDISGWHTENVENMTYMFRGASSFHSDLSKWNTGKVKDMSRMFFEASSFNSDLSCWDVSKVENMSHMFYEASSFTSDLSNWSVGSVTDMSNMFRGASEFTSDLSNWDVSNVRNMYCMFYGLSSFESDLSKWKTDKVTNMRCMFCKAGNFTSDLSSWNVENVTDMYGMFYQASKFDSDLSDWQTAKVTNMSYMFYKAGSVKNIDLLANANTNIISENILNGSSPETIKFTNLESFTWVLPDKYELKKGSIGSQELSIVEKGSSITFDENTRYELYKLPIISEVSINDFTKVYDTKAITVDDLMGKLNNPLNIDGTLSFKENTEIKDAGEYHVTLTFTPSNTNDFSAKDLELKITINEQ